MVGSEFGVNILPCVKVQAAGGSGGSGMENIFLAGIRFFNG